MEGKQIVNDKHGNKTLPRTKPNAEQGTHNIT